MVRRVGIAMVGLALLLGAFAPAADATPSRPQIPTSLPQPTGTVSGPTPVPAPPIDYPAGDVCPFPVHAAFPVNRVVAYTYTDASGRVVAQYFTGPLIGQITRTDTGRTVRVGLSGKGVELYDPAGDGTLYGAGPYLVGLHAGDTPAHELARPTGLSELRISADGTKTLVYASSVQNLCDELR
jgi:hypothetical protein